jgi:hypothetical protein
MIQKKLTELKNILNYQLKQTIKNVDREFSKAPIDTGLMLKTTELVSITLNTDTLDVELNIKSQEYLKYVENGWGSNKKYGERRVREEAIKSPDVNAALESLYAAVLEEDLVAKLKGKNVSKATYKV